MAGDPAPTAGEHDAEGDHHGDTQADLLAPGQGHEVGPHGKQHLAVITARAPSFPTDFSVYEL